MKSWSAIASLTAKIASTIYAFVIISNKSFAQNFIKCSSKMEILTKKKVLSSVMDVKELSHYRKPQENPRSPITVANASMIFAWHVQWQRLWRLNNLN